MRIRNFLLSVALGATAMVVGCSVDTNDVDGETTVQEAERRQKIGKADKWGSCKLTNGNDKCGKKGTGNCYCDKACVEYDDCCVDFTDTCSEGESGLCVDMGGKCLSSPIDVTFGANCEADYGMETIDGACAAFNNSCCKAKECQPVLCELFCANGFATGDDGCAICSCADEPPPIDFCGGFAGLPCPDGEVCIDNPNDSCDPQNGGADCGGICVDSAPPVASCQGLCGSASPDKACYCDTACVGYGDCCDDYQDECTGRNKASGQCIKNSNDSCTTDADCVSGGCGGELCFNPGNGGGISTCECTAPQGVACGCVAGTCNWWN